MTAIDADQPGGFRLTYQAHGQPEAVDFAQARVVIGRAKDCDLVLTAPDVSRRHATIERDADGWTLHDLTSRHGTFVNRQRVVSRRLAEGDQITVGLGTDASSTFAFHLPPKAHGQLVSFDGGRASTQVHLTIDVENYERSIDAPDAAAPVAAPIPPDAERGEQERAKAPPERPKTLLDAIAGPAQDRRPRVSIVSLFRQVGEVLLTSDDLEQMLGKVVDLAMHNLSAERACICLCDEKTDAITPKVTRVEGVAEGDSINISRSIAREAIRARQALLVTDALADGRFASSQSIRFEGIRAAMCAPLYHAGRVEGLIYVDSLGADRFTAADLELLTALGVLTAVGIVQARLRDDVARERAIRARLSRYSSPHVVDQIVAGAGGLGKELLAQEREVTVLFADLSRFTPMVEGAEPACVAQVLNSAFEHLTHAVFLHDGTLDKYLGDGLLAIFGAPLAQADHADKAIRTALLMQQILEEGSLTGPRGERLQMRIGINSGMAVVGDIGSATRKDYTVVGDAINVASRLESSVAEPGQIVVGPATYELSKHRFELEPLPEIQLRGKQQRIRPYLVLGRKCDAPSVELTPPPPGT
jgi:adenylate cyclase